MVIIHFFTISLVIFTAVFITMGLCTMLAVKGVKKIWSLALITAGILFFIQTPDEHERYEMFMKMNGMLPKHPVVSRIAVQLRSV